MTLLKNIKRLIVSSLLLLLFSVSVHAGVGDPDDNQLWIPMEWRLIQIVDAHAIYQNPALDRAFRRKSFLVSIPVKNIRWELVRGSLLYPSVMRHNGSLVFVRSAMGEDVTGFPVRVKLYRIEYLDKKK